MYIADNLFNFYLSFAKEKKWTIEILHIDRLHVNSRLPKYNHIIIRIFICPVFIDIDSVAIPNTPIDFSLKRELAVGMGVIGKRSGISFDGVDIYVFLFGLLFTSEDLCFVFL